jgi:NTE family protein
MKFERADRERGERREVVNGPLPSPSKTITLLPLSRELPIGAIGSGLAASLRSETAEPVVLVKVHQGESPAAQIRSDYGQGTVVDWAFSEVVLQSIVSPQVLRSPEGFYFTHVNLEHRPMTPEQVDVLLAQLKRSFRYIVIELSAGQRSAVSQRLFLGRSDASYILFKPCGEDPSDQQRLLAEISEASEAGRSQPRLVCCLPKEKPIDGFEFLANTLKGGHQTSLEDTLKSGHRTLRTAPTFIHDCPAVRAADEIVSPASLSSLFKADVRRLAREISGRLVGIALSSGAAKGLAHVGVIQVLEENGIEVDVVAGASIGAYIGALWTFGHDGKELERLARRLETRWGFWSLFDPVFPPRQGFVRGFALRKRLMESIGNARFADLARPLRIVAANLATLERVTFAGGEVAAAAHASFAVPGICVPVRLDGEMYIDGGIVDPVPVDILREMGAAKIIAVNAIPAPGEGREGLRRNRDGAPKKRNRFCRLFRRKVLPLTRQLNYFAPGNLFEIVVRSVHGAQVRLAEASCRLADVVLRPNTCDDRWLDCRNPGRFMALGRQEAEQRLEQIKALVARKDLLNGEEIREPMAALV